jgi:integrase
VKYQKHEHHCQPEAHGVSWLHKHRDCSVIAGDKRMKAKITQKVVDGATPGSKRYLIVDAGDGAIKGFAVRVYPTGKKVAVLNYRMGGRATDTQTFTIGTFGGRITAAFAREVAARAKADITQGIDPQQARRTRVADRKAKQEAARAAQANRVELVLEEHIAALAARKKPLRSLKERARMLRKETVGTEEKPGPWRGKIVGTLSEDDVVELIEDIGERSAATARLTFSYLRPFFKSARREKKCQVNPTLAVDLKELGLTREARSRFLTPDELRAVWRATYEVPEPYGPVLRLLVLTGQRRSEVAGMAAEEIGAVSASSWTIPPERAKNGKKHIVHLSPQALAELAGRRRNRGLIFASTKGTRLTGWSKIKKMLDEKSGVSGWRLHDLRRTFATVAAETLKVPPHVADKVLNHVAGVINGVQAVYQHAEFLEEREQALNAWGAFVAKLASAAEESRDAA